MNLVNHRSHSFLDVTLLVPIIVDQTVANYTNRFYAPIICFVI